MAELLIRVIDRIPDNDPDRADDAQRATKRGDVIAVQPDGWNWGRVELTAPFWRILKIPDASVEDFLHLLEPPADELPDDPTPARRITLDLDSPGITEAIKAILDDDERHAQAVRVPKSLLIACIKDRARRPSKRFIG